MSRLEAARLFVLGLVLATPFVAVAMQAGDEKNDKLLGVPSSRPGPQASTPGRLILDGALVLPPYEVAVVDDAVEINGRSTEKRVGTAAPVVVDARTEIEHRALESLHAAFPGWVVPDDPEAALHRAIRFLEEQPLVESVAEDSPTSLRVKFQGERYEEIVELSPVDPDPPAPAEVRQQYLADRARAIEHWLAQGHVVILGDGVSMVMPPAEAESLLGQLEEIVNSHPDLNARAEAIKRIVPDDSLAQAIARRFLQDDAEGGRR